jgi:hypothetical protein
MVYKLYNLTYEEVKIIYSEIEKIISKQDTEREEIYYGVCELVQNRLNKARSVW